jgi:phosphoglycerol transferase MdoB-like AlkP superfamily enzyme
VQRGAGFEADDRVPDVVGVAQHSVVYTGAKGKISEHGGWDPQDRDVPLVVSFGANRHETSSETVDTTRTAPTILKLVGLNPNYLQAVQIEHAKALDPG